MLHKQNYKLILLWQTVVSIKNLCSTNIEPNFAYGKESKSNDLPNMFLMIFDDGKNIQLIMVHFDSNAWSVILKQKRNLKKNRMRSENAKHKYRRCDFSNI